MLLLFSLPSAEVFYGLLAIIVLLAASALISGSEVAFFSLTHNDFDGISRQNDASSANVMYLRSHPRKLLATILISNNLVNIAIVLLSDYLIQLFISEALLQQWADGVLYWVPLLQDYVAPLYMAQAMGFLTTVVAATFVLLFFGEVMPKVYAGSNKVSLAKIMAGPMISLMSLFHPLSVVLVKSTLLIEGRLYRHRLTNNKTSREDIDEAIDLTVKNEDDLDDQELDILKSIVKFGDVTVTQIMRSRLDVVAVDFRLDYAELLAVVRECGYSRIPVYETDLDTVTGVLYVKDLLPYLHEPAAFEWQSLIRTDVLFVPESKRINDLLRDFQRRHLHLGIVVDEYGGTTGIVTLEDILEEVIGDIRDEFDDESEIMYKKIDDHNYVFDGKTMLNDMCRVLSIDTAYFDDVRGEADSVAGMILETIGRLPVEKESIDIKECRFEAVKVGERRIEEILVVLPKE